MVLIRSQIEKLTREEMIEELLQSSDISIQLKALIDRFDTFASKNEEVKSDLLITKICNTLLHLAPQNESCPTKSSGGGTLLHSSDHLSYKPRNDLCIYKSTKLESTFTEILIPKKTNVTVGCIYCHPHMDLHEINDYYINNLLNKFSKEN